MGETSTQNVTDLDTFVKLLTQWHNNGVAQLKHVLDIPEGTEVTLDDTKTLVLVGDSLTAFQAGVTVALSTLGKLPFAVEFEPVASEPAVDG